MSNANEESPHGYIDEIDLVAKILDGAETHLLSKIAHQLRSYIGQGVICFCEAGGDYPFCRSVLDIYERDGRKLALIHHKRIDGLRDALFFQDDDFESWDIRKFGTFAASSNPSALIVMICQKASKVYHCLKDILTYTESI